MIFKVLLQSSRPH